MSRRKVRGLTKTGRQVSEDPDLDSLLSNLSPEEMEELQKEVSVVPDPDPGEIFVVDQNQPDLKPAAPVKKETQSSSQTDDLKSRFQRNLSNEGEPKKESRKQEYLRKMGLSQEKNTSVSDSRDGELQRTSSASSFPKRDGRMEDRTRRVTEGFKDDKFGPSAISKKDEESERKVEAKEQNNGSKFKDRKEMRESSSSKTKELISKLQEKKEVSKEKTRKEDSRKKESGESRAKEMISRIKEKEEKEKERKEEIRKREENKTKGYASRLEEKQNQVLEDKPKEERKDKDEKQIRRTSEKTKEAPTLEVRGLAENKEKEPEKVCENVKKPQEYNAKSSDKERGDVQNEIVNEVHEPKEEKIGNCVSDTISKRVSTKEEEEEDESASMFDEDLERVRCNNPGMTDLNVNNSEVIKTKTLIQFAEALKNNTHIKAFSLANCRADDHVAYAIAETLRTNKSITSINLDSNLLTSKGIMALIHALQHNATLTELRFHNQRHIIGGKSEMEMTKILKENTTLLKLGYHFELAGPRMTMTNILSRNMDRQRQKRLQEQKQAQAQGTGDKKDSLEVPKSGFGKGSPRTSPRPSPIPSPIPSPAPSPKLSHKKRASGLVGGPPPPPPPPGGPPPPPPPMLDGDFLKNSLTPVSQRKLDDRSGGRAGAQNSRDQLLASIRGSNIKQLKKVAVPKLLQ